MYYFQPEAIGVGHWTSDAWFSAVFKIDTIEINKYNPTSISMDYYAYYSWVTTTVNYSNGNSENYSNNNLNINSEEKIENIIMNMRGMI